MSAKKTSAPRKKRSEGKLIPALCNIVGTVLFAAVLLLTLPLAAPRLLGYDVFDVLSGSMEPELPVGSAVYVRAVEPTEVDVDEVIAFYNSEGNVVVHRVVTNRTSLGEFVTKGDANNVEDREPIPYDALLGRVMLHIPVVGRFMALYSSNVGKVYLLLTAACGVMLNMLADRMRANSRAHAEALAEAASELGVAELAQEAGMVIPQGGGWMRVVVVIFLLAIFAGSGGVVVFVNMQHKQSDEVYEEASQRFVAPTPEGVVAPITIDFAELQAVNKDVIGWIYCEGTPINYPVLRGTDNDEYLHHDYTHEYNIDGSIFVDSENKGDFTDANTIIYGHHMGLTGSMFTCLKYWGEQDFYDEHPVMWLLTPTRDYQVQLVSGHHVSAISGYYDIIREHDAKFNSMLADAVNESDFDSLFEASPDANYVMLSTCAYIFDNARYALHGMLVPIDSAGGVPLK